MTRSIFIRQSGLTIVELMIALLISSILVAGVFGVFIASHKNWTTSQNLNSVATKARHFSTFFSHDVRMAGFNGKCNPSSVRDGLKWNKGKNKLTIKFCNNGSPDVIKYLFNRKQSSCTSSGGSNVCYYNSQNKVNKNNNPKHLLAGLHFISIWFGRVYTVKNNIKKLKYINGNSGSPNFNKIKTVKLRFKLFSTNITKFQLANESFVKPVINYTIDIRNNNF